MNALHPLLDHLLDVAACFAEIARCPAVRRALTTLAQRALVESDLARLTALAFLHDLGKANAGFQVKFWSGTAPGGWPRPGGHGSEALQLLEAHPRQSAAFQARQCLPLDDIFAWGDAACALLVASISHHGRPIRPIANAAECIWQPSGQGADCYDPRQTLTAIGEHCKSLYPAAFHRAAQPLPDQPRFSHLFAGLVQLADWLGSDTRPGFFPYTEPDEDRRVTAPIRARRAVSTIGLSPTTWREELQLKGLQFSHAFALPQPRDMQSATADLTMGPVVILEAETGSGKTEAALWRFLQLFHAGAVDSLYFALPTRVAATQLYDRVLACVARLWPSCAPVVVRALPGYEAADGQLQEQRLPTFEVLWGDHAQDTEAERRWSAETPKRYLAAPLAVGTIDQVLLATLPLKHAHLRHALLTRSLLVVDEVHASDAYMTALLEKTLQAHVASGGQALLLSATLGSRARHRFLAIGPSQRQAQRPTLAPNLQLACEAPYPVLSHNGIAPAFRAVMGNPTSKHVTWHLLDAIDSPERIAGLATAAAMQGARVLVVRNTVPAAIATLRCVEALVADAPGRDVLFRVNGVSTLHHSRFSKQDRPLLDRAVEHQLGKRRSTPGGRIVIGTQTLEQSLDLDADVLITDLCPMDVLLQRVGRLHRHQRPSIEHPNDRRPSGFENATTWVLTPPNGDLGALIQRSRHGLGSIRIGGALEGIYPDLRILEATRRLIAQSASCSIPTDNRLLVEQATHPEALQLLCDELGPEWSALGESLDGLAAGRASHARLQAIDFDRPFGDDLFPQLEEKIATRLGASDRVVLLADAPVGPFGQPVHALTLRHHQLPRSLNPEQQALNLSHLGDCRGFEFELGDCRYRYDRFGLVRLTNSGTRFESATQ